MSAAGYGSTQPLVPYTDPHGDHVNRRVDIVVLSTASAEANALLPGLDAGAHRRSHAMSTKDKDKTAEAEEHRGQGRQEEAAGHRRSWSCWPLGAGAYFFLFSRLGEGRRRPSRAPSCRSTRSR